MGEASTSELWKVKLPNGETQTVTLEQLDDAYQADRIAETTPVQRPGSVVWITLAEAAGISSAEVAVPEPAFSSPFALTSPASELPSLRPMVTDGGDELEVELDEPSLAFMNPRRGRAVMLAAAALVAILGGGAFALKGRTTATVASVQTPVVEPSRIPAPPALVEPPKPVEPAVAQASPPGTAPSTTTEARAASKSKKSRSRRHHH